MQLNVVDGKRQYLFDEEGRRYLDAFGGIATVCCGHCHPDMWSRQLSTKRSACNTPLSSTSTLPSLISPRPSPPSFPVTSRCVNVPSAVAGFLNIPSHVETYIITCVFFFFFETIISCVSCCVIIDFFFFFENG
jgi:hypothetical protein